MLTEQQRYDDLKMGLESLTDLIVTATSLSGQPLLLVVFGEWAMAWLAFMVRNEIVSEEQVSELLLELRSELETKMTLDELEPTNGAVTADELAGVL